MTAAGQAQATAAEKIAPALTTFNRSFARTCNTTQADHTIIAAWLHACLGRLASAVNDTGYDAAGRWRGAFLAGQAGDPEWLQRTTHNAASLIQQAANLTIPIRAVKQTDVNMKLPAMQAGHAAWQASHDLTELIAEHHRACTRPQVPDYLAVLAALYAACDPLAGALAAIAPRLAGIDPDWDSVWCEDFDGELSADYQDAARWCRSAAPVLATVRTQLTADTRIWRSRSRPRPATTEGRS